MTGGTGGPISWRNYPSGRRLVAPEQPERPYLPKDDRLTRLFSEDRPESSFVSSERSYARPRGSRHGLEPARLVELTRTYAGDVAEGRYPQLRFDADQRWHERIFRDSRVDVWLISWLPTQGTELHDHGGSAGAFSVLAGELSEVSYLPGTEGRGSLVERARPAGESVAFGPYYVHDVRNLSTGPAVSVHAYSPPLDLMRYYDLADGRLSKIASLATDDPDTGLADAGGLRSGVAS
jgi:Cysteine dioxygenase type I